MDKNKQRTIFVLIWLAILIVPTLIYWLIVRDLSKLVGFTSIFIGISVPLFGLMAWRLGFSNHWGFIGTAIMGAGMLIARAVDSLNPMGLSMWGSSIQTVTMIVGLLVQAKGAPEQPQMQTPLPYLPSFPKLMFMFFATMMLVYGITRLTDEYFIDPFVLIVFVILPILLLGIAVAHTLLTREQPRA